MSSSPRGTNSLPMTELASLSLKQSSEGFSVSTRHSSRERLRSANGNGVDQEESSATTLTLRALVSTKEAGVIIGKGGANVASLRDISGVKAGVSKVIPGVNHRVLTVTGTLQGVAKAFSMIASTLLDNPAVPGPTSNGLGANLDGQAAIHLLISHALMGTVIGRQGLKIKHIQDVSRVRMVTSKAMLPSSTERSVEIQGSPQGIELAITTIGKYLLADWERGEGTILYQPSQSTVAVGSSMNDDQGQRTNTKLFGSYSTGPDVHQSGPVVKYAALPASSNGTSAAAAVNPGGELVLPTNNEASIPAQVAEGDMWVQNIGIPSDMVGCIIGKGGSKISEIRRLSGSRINIAKMTHDESGERMFTIQGPVASNEKALFLLYNSLELEKKKRAEAAAAAQAEKVAGAGVVGGQQAVEA